MDVDILPTQEKQSSESVQSVNADYNRNADVRSNEIPVIQRPMQGCPMALQVAYVDVDARVSEQRSEVREV